jgi:hypothetical protein
MTQILHIPKIIFGVSRTYYKTPLLRLLDTKIRTLLDRGTVSDVDGKLIARLTSIFIHHVLQHERKYLT